MTCKKVYRCDVTSSNITFSGVGGGVSLYKLSTLKRKSASDTRKDIYIHAATFWYPCVVSRRAHWSPGGGVTSACAPPPPNSWPTSQSRTRHTHSLSVHYATRHRALWEPLCSVPRSPDEIGDSHRSGHVPEKERSLGAAFVTCQGNS